MPYKYCVPQWKSNYLSEEKKKNEKESVYRFPINEKERKDGLEQYHMKILLLIIIFQYAVTIILPTVNHLSHIVAKKDLLSPFPFLMVFQLSSPPNKLRKTVSTLCSSSRNVIPDELEADNLVYEKVRIII